MIPIIISGLILMKKRMMIEVIPPPVRKCWNEWELVGAALLSLTLQVVLIMTGNRRKDIHGPWFRVIVWCTYMMADSVATMALGILSNDLGEIYDAKDHINMGTDALIIDDRGHMEGTELKAFWAPFFLLHLGGPDTITAYSLEDNELFLRHFSGLVVQTITALYIFLLAWSSSHISYLSIVMIVVGSIKYGERTWSLWKASREKLQNTILTDPDAGPNYSKFMEEYSLKDAEGFCVEIIEMKDSQGPQGNSNATVPGKTAGNEHNLVKAHALFQTFKSLFADLILSSEDRKRSQDLFKEMTDEDAFKVIEIELGFMYDLLYTKAPIVYTPWGFARRFITFSLTCFAFLSFILDDKLRHKRKTTDFVVTSLLLVVGILLEIYAALVVLVSDETRTWLIKQRKKTSTAQSSAQTLDSPFKDWFKWFKAKRWSNSMAQYSLLWLSLKEKRSFRIIEEFRYKKYENFNTDYRKLIFDHVRKKFEEFEKQRAQPEARSTSTLETAIKEFCSQRGQGIIEKYQKQKREGKIEWSISSVEFDQSILIWHMATEICYYSKDEIENLSEEVKKSRAFSLQMSRYMFYLLVICPFMLPVGIGFIRFRDTCAEAMKFFKEQMSTSMDEGTASRDEGTVHALLKILRKICSSSSSSVADVEQKRKKACELLLEKKTNDGSSKSVLLCACQLASMLNTSFDPGNKWNLVRDMWLELLAYAACHCRGNDHARQLGQGGELLTHMWLLMAHFGLTEQFQISQGHARAKLLTK